MVVLKTLCVITIPVMLVSLVVSERTESQLASITFIVTLVVIALGLLNMATDFAWPSDDENED